MRGAAFALTLELVVALPDHPAVFVGAVPDLRAEVVTAVAADQTAGKNGLAAVASAQRLSPDHLFLHPVEQERVDDCFVAVLHIVLRDLTLVDLHFLLQKINRELLLANDSNFDRNPLRGCNYGLEGGAVLNLGGAVLCQRKRSAFMK